MLILIFLISNIQNFCQFDNTIVDAIHLNKKQIVQNVNEPYYEKGYTFTGWFQFYQNKIRESVNIFQLINNDDFYRSKCPFEKTEQLKNEQLMQQAKDNKYCQFLFKNEFLKNLKLIQINYEYQADQTYLEILLPIKEDLQNQQKHIISERLEISNLSENSWFFVAVSSDFSLNISTIFIQTFSENTNQQQYKKSIELLTSNFYISTINQFVYLSERITMEDIGQVINSNLFYQSFKNVELFVTYDNKIESKLQFDFVPNFDFRQIKSLTPHIEFSDFAQFDIDHLILKNGQYVNISTKNYNENTNLNFYIDVNFLTKYQDQIFMRIKNSDFQIDFQFTTILDTVYFLVTVQKNMQIIYNKIFFNIKLEYENQQRFLFTLHNVMDIGFMIQIIQMNNNFFQQTNILKDLFLKSDYQISLGSQGYTQNLVISLFRISLFDNSLPFLYKLETTLDINKYSNNCEIPLINDDTIDGCFKCKYGVLSSDYKCEKFCPLGLKNLNGICKICSDKLCSEIEQPQLTIKRVSNNDFIIQFDQGLPQLNQFNIYSTFQINLNRFQNKVDYTYILQYLSPKEVLLQIQPFFTIRNTYLEISENKDYLLFYNYDLNAVQNFQERIPIQALHYIGKTEKNMIQTINIALQMIFLLLIFLMLYIGINKKWFNNESTLKKCIQLFQEIQFLPLLLFLHTTFPTNLHIFLRSLFDKIIGFNRIFSDVNNQMDSVNIIQTHPNLFDLQLNPLFVQNFRVVFIFHIIVYSFYVGILIVGIPYKRMPRKINQFIKYVKEFIEYNFLFLIFTSFVQQIVIFSILNFQATKSNNALVTISLVVSIVYFALTLILIIAFPILYFANNFFIADTTLKHKLNYLFAGFKNDKKSNFFEYSRYFVYFFVALNLILLQQNAFIQMLIVLVLMFILFAEKQTINPYLKSFDAVYDFINQFILLVCLSLTTLTSVISSQTDDKNSIFQTILGWFIIISLIIKILFSIIVIIIEIFLTTKKNIIEWQVLNDHNLLDNT